MVNRYLSYYFGDEIYTDQIKLSPGNASYEQSVAEYLADIKKIADFIPIKPKAKFTLTPKKYSPAIQIPAKEVKPVKYKAGVLKQSIKKLGNKKRRLLKTFYSQNEIEAIAAASYIKGLNSAREISDDELDAQVMIALHSVRETTLQWDEYQQTITSSIKAKNDN